MARCTVCGSTDNPPEYTFCCRCGASLPEPTAVETREIDAVPLTDFEVISRSAEAEVYAATRRQTKIFIAVGIALVLIFCACMCCSATMFFWITRPEPAAVDFFPPF